MLVSVQRERSVHVVAMAMFEMSRSAVGVIQVLGLCLYIAIKNSEMARYNAVISSGVKKGTTAAPIQ
jgi:hypothetical protein